MMAATQIGRPTRRVDGPQKVTGRAKYAAEYPAPGLLYGYLVTSGIAKGRILSIQSSEAAKIPGFVQIFTHENMPPVSGNTKDYDDDLMPPGVHFMPMHDSAIYFNNQPIALVVAETFEAARDAASLVKVTYAAEPHQTDLTAASADAYVPPKKRSGVNPPPSPRGDASHAFGLATHRLEQNYEVPFEHHNPMEPFATTCIWNGDGTITIHDKTQGSQNCQQYVAHIFGFDKKDVRVLNHFVGGGFGSGLRPQVSLFFAVMASKALQRSVRVVLARDQMYGALPHRPHTLQTLKLGANVSGKIEAIEHIAIAGTSSYEDYQESVVNWTSLMYSADNVSLDYQLAKLNTSTPGDMRAPGAVIGQFASESAADEMAYMAGIDPVQFRLLNYTDHDANENKRFTSKSLREALRVGGDAFGWNKRTAEPRSMRDGTELVGWGVATAAWEAMFQKTAATATLDSTGRLVVASATSDIGTGSYTVMAMTAAEALGLPLDRVEARLGDSDLPAAPVEGGSWGAASTCSAVLDACKTLKEKIVSAARGMSLSPFAHADADDLIFADGLVYVTNDPARRVSLADIVQSTGSDTLTASGTAGPSMIDKLRWASYSHAAIFCEVRVDEELGNIRLTRVICAVAAGRILNPKTARSQILGGIIMAHGSALTEETLMDHRFGRFMNANMADYHIPANADVDDLQVIFVHEDDEKVSPIGAKGLGEIGIVGTGAAIANAVFHATGNRVRTLPITCDKALGLV